MKNEICNTCIFLGTPPAHEPCKYCIDVYHSNSTAVKHTRSQYRNAAPTREELLARLEKLQGEYDALLDCYAQWEEPNEKGEFFVDFGKVLVEHEAQLTTANAEIESMHRELEAARQQAADRQAIIEEQNREIDEAKKRLDECDTALAWQDIEPEMLACGALVDVVGEVVKIETSKDETKYYVQFIHRNGGTNGAVFMLEDIRRILE